MRLTTTFAALAAISCGHDTGETRQADTVLHSSQFAYDATGMPTVITVDAISHTVPALSRDALGRATSINGAALSYGPDGALATATRGADTFEYITDEAGHRLAKRKNGAFVEAYVDEGLVADTTLYMPVRMAGTTVGVVHDGRYESIAADTRGTVLADAAGVTRAAAFGERDRASTLERAIDYAQSGRDPDLGTIRMGVRDYDPATHQFTTPDPLFLADPAKCVGDPIECNLYGYAKDRPADFVDPGGTQAVPTQPSDRGWSGWMDTRAPSAKIDIGIGQTAGYRKQIGGSADMRTGATSARAEVSASWFKAGAGGSWGSRKGHHVSLDFNLTGPAAKAGLQADLDRASVGVEARVFKEELALEGCYYACAKAAVSIQLGFAFNLRFENGRITAEIGAAVVGAKISIGVEKSVEDAAKQRLQDDVNQGVGGLYQIYRRFRF